MSAALVSIMQREQMRYGVVSIVASGLAGASRHRSPGVSMLGLLVAGLI
jgi:hypothetical protein